MYESVSKWSVAKTVSSLCSECNQRHASPYLREPFARDGRGTFAEGHLGEWM